MRVGMMLPTFTTDLGPALDAAAVADAGGLDGVFAFDHLWPMGSPGRPALWSFGVLGAVAAATDHLTVGPLVARIDLLPENEFVAIFTTLAAMIGTDRVIAAFGTGDNLSAAENLAYGLPRRPVAERLELLARVCDRVRGRGITTWLGGNSDAIAALADAHADAHNVWAMDAGEIARQDAGGGHVPRTWGGQVLVGRDAKEIAALRSAYGDRPRLVSGTVDEVAAHLRRLGVTWSVCAPLDYLTQPVRATETVCLVAKAVQ